MSVCNENDINNNKHSFPHKLNVSLDSIKPSKQCMLYTEQNKEFKFHRTQDAKSARV